MSRGVIQNDINQLFKCGFGSNLRISWKLQKIGVYGQLKLQPITTNLATESLISAPDMSTVILGPSDGHQNSFCFCEEKRPQALLRIQEIIRFSFFFSWVAKTQS